MLIVGADREPRPGVDSPRLVAADVAVTDPPEGSSNRKSQVSRSEPVDTRIGSILPLTSVVTGALIVAIELSCIGVVDDGSRLSLDAAAVGIASSIACVLR